MGNSGVTGNRAASVPGPGRQRRLSGQSLLGQSLTFGLSLAAERPYEHVFFRSLTNAGKCEIRHTITRPRHVKQYILDTTVLLYDANALNAFGDNTVIIPVVVIEDIDHFKKDLSETGRNARQTSRWLDQLRAQGTLTEGVNLENGGKLFVKLGADAMLDRMPAEFRQRTRDTLMLATALEVKNRAEGVQTVLVSKDINLRIKADSIGIEVEDYESERVDIEELYAGWEPVEAKSDIIDQFMAQGWIEPGKRFFPNEYVVLTDPKDPAHYAIGRYDSVDNRIVRLLRIESREGIATIEPRNPEQAMAMDALLDDNIQMVTLLGKAGTGKTLLAVAASIYKTVEENVFSRILVSRPTLPMGKDIGYLPGSVEEKLTPWMYPIADNIEFLMRDGNAGVKRGKPGFRELIDMGILVIEPLTYIRGRSIHNQYLIVDEAQNLTPHEIKTIITRVGDGTKIIVTGDPYQIDNPYIDSSSNGLAYVVERFKNQKISAHVTLKRGERSSLSELAANLL